MRNRCCRISAKEDLIEEPNLYSVFSPALAYDRKPSLGRVREIPTPTPDHRRVPFRLRLSEPDEANARVAAVAVLSGLHLQKDELHLATPFRTTGPIPQSRWLKAKSKFRS
jgi:hypothetical protein